MLRKELKHLFLLRLNYCFGLQIPNDCQKLFIFYSFSCMDFIYTNRFYICVQSAGSFRCVRRGGENFSRK